MHLGIHCWQIDEDISKKLSSATDLDGIVFFNQYEFDYTRSGTIPILDILSEYAANKNIPLYVVTGGTKENPLMYDITNKKYQNLQPLIHWETFWMARCYFTYDKNHHDVLDIHDMDSGQYLTDFRYKFITMNFKLPYHRCCLVDLLYKNNLFDSGCISFHFYGDNVNNRPREYKWKYWTPKEIVIDYRKDEDRFDGQGNLPIQWVQSFMQIVTETDVEYFFISEKTSTPLFFSKPFLVLGPKGYHKMLQRMGFKLYDEIFDYSFDDIENLEDRIESLLQNIKSLESCSLKDLQEKYRLIWPKLKYNKQLVHKLAFDREHIPNLLLDLYQKNDQCLAVDGFSATVLSKALGKT